MNGDSRCQPEAATPYQHVCPDLDCCYHGQPSFRGCGCYRTREQMMLARIEELTKALEWRPIETAPMDGTEIIGVFHRRYDEDGPATVYGPWTVAWDGRKWRSSWDGSEVISSESDFGTEYKGPDIDPTHWQPLPGVSIPLEQSGSGK